MNKFFKRIVVTGAILTASIGLTACGTKDKNKGDNQNPATTISYVLTATNTVYEVDDNFTLNGLKLVGSDGVEIAVTSDMISNIPDMTTSGKKNVIINYDGKQYVLEIEVVSYSLTSTKLKYMIDETFDVSSLKLVCTNNSEIAVNSDMLTTAIDTSSAGKKQVEVSFQGRTYQLDIEVFAYTLLNSKINYAKGDSFDIASLKLTGYEGVEVEVTANMIETMPNMNLSNDQTITVIYNGRRYTTTITINQTAKEIYNSAIDKFLSNYENSNNKGEVKATAKFDLDTKFLADNANLNEEYVANIAELKDFANYSYDEIINYIVTCSLNKNNSTPLNYENFTAKLDLIKILEQSCTDWNNLDKKELIKSILNNDVLTKEDDYYTQPIVNFICENFKINDSIVKSDVKLQVESLFTQFKNLEQLDVNTFIIEINKIVQSNRCGLDAEYKNYINTAISSLRQLETDLKEKNPNAFSTFISSIQSIANIYGDNYNAYVNTIAECLKANENGSYITLSNIIRLLEPTVKVVEGATQYINEQDVYIEIYYPTNYYETYWKNNFEKTLITEELIVSSNSMLIENKTNYINALSNIVEQIENFDVNNISNILTTISNNIQTAIENQQALNDNYAYISLTNDFGEYNDYTYYTIYDGQGYYFNIGYTVTPQYLPNEDWEDIKNVVDTINTLYTDGIVAYLEENELIEKYVKITANFITNNTNLEITQTQQTIINDLIYSLLKREEVDLENNIVNFCNEFGFDTQKYFDNYNTNGHYGLLADLVDVYVKDTVFDQDSYESLLALATYIDETTANGFDTALFEEKLVNFVNSLNIVEFLEENNHVEELVDLLAKEVLNLTGVEISETQQQLLIDTAYKFLKQEEIDYETTIVDFCNEFDLDAQKYFDNYNNNGYYGILADFVDIYVKDTVLDQESYDSLLAIATYIDQASVNGYSNSTFANKLCEFISSLDIIDYIETNDYIEYVISNINDELYGTKYYIEEDDIDKISNTILLLIKQEADIRKLVIDLSSIYNYDTEKYFNNYDQTGSYYLLSDIATQMLEETDFDAELKQSIIKIATYIDEISINGYDKQEFTNLVHDLAVNMHTHLLPKATNYSRILMIKALAHLTNNNNSLQTNIHNLVEDFYNYTENDLSYYENLIIKALVHLTNNSNNLADNLYNYVTDLKYDLVDELANMTAHFLLTHPDQYDFSNTIMNNSLQSTASIKDPEQIRLEQGYEELRVIYLKHINAYLNNSFDVNCYRDDMIAYINEYATGAVKSSVYSIASMIAVNQYINSGEEIDFNELFSFIKLPDEIESIDYNKLIETALSETTYAEMFKTSGVNLQYITNENGDIIKEILTIDVEINYDIMITSVTGNAQFILEIEF